MWRTFRYKMGLLLVWWHKLNLQIRPVLSKQRRRSSNTRQCTHNTKHKKYYYFTWFICVGYTFDPALSNWHKILSPWKNKKTLIYFIHSTLTQVTQVPQNSRVTHITIPPLSPPSDSPHSVFSLPPQPPQTHPYNAQPTSSLHYTSLLFSLILSVSLSHSHSVTQFHSHSP